MEGKRECFGKYVNSSSVCYCCSDEAECLEETLGICRTKIKPRLGKDQYYLNIANAVSKRSTCLKRQYGCVIVNNDEIVSTGYNGSPRGESNCCDFGKCSRLNKPHNSGDYSDCPSIHAEQNAMISSSRKEMLGATMYLNGYDVTDEGLSPIEKVEPCPICLRMIKNSGIERVISNIGIVWERS